MDTKHSTNFFLGSNSKNGFFSLYDSFADIDGGDFFWLIKGGPGCGKSSFMRRIGEAAEFYGLQVEYIQCSGDPDSLDGIYIPQKRLGYMDATAPHVLDCALPAAADAYLNLGAFYDSDSLRQHRRRLVELNAKYKRLYKRVYSLTAAAGCLSAGEIPELISEADRALAKKRALGMAEREFGRAQANAKNTEKHRLLSAISCKGLVRLYDTVDTICSRIIALDDDFGLADIYLKTLVSCAKTRSLNTIICHDPLHPERLEAVLIPQISLAFVATRSGFGAIPHADRNIRLDSIISKERIRELRPKIRNTMRIKNAILDEAVSTFKETKILHDEIEGIYNPYVDFSELYSLADRHIRAMLS